MINNRLAVVGGGQMGRALVSGMLASEIIDSAQVQIVEPNRDSQQWWQTNHPAVAVTDSFAADNVDVVVLAVKPNIVESVTRPRPADWHGRLMISIAAGVRLAKLAEWIGHQRIVRVMPNTPCLVGCGASGYCCGQDVTDDDVDKVEAILGAVGLVAKVSESQLDAVTGLSGSGPAYIFLAIEALADGGVLAGLPRSLAMQLATQTVLGSAKLVAETGRHPAELKDAVASPGGTTIAALRTLEQNGFRAALIGAVAAAAARSRELGND